MTDLIRQFLGDRTDRRAEIAREVVQSVASLPAPVADKPCLTVLPDELEAIVRLVLAQWGVR